MGIIKEYRSIVFVWLAWSLVVPALVAYLPGRFTLTGPDRALEWTAAETQPGAPSQSNYLDPPVLGGHVAWDSEYYLSIALGGYDDPASRAISRNFTWYRSVIAPLEAHPAWVSLNYAFFPGYPFTIRAVATPALVLGVDPLSAATVAGVLVSLLGALAAMVGLYRLGRGIFNVDTGRRAAFYLLIAPASVFLAMVYTEGLFLGLSFLALALAREGRYVPAGLLAAAATLTKAAGGLLIVPLVLYWFLARGKGRAWYEIGPLDWTGLGFLLAPVAAYGVFTLTLGPAFHFVEGNYFGRRLLALGDTIVAWVQAIERMGTEPQAFAYYAIELACLGVGVWTLVWLAKREPVLALYGALSLLFSLTTGVAQGMHRYVLALPSLFLVPAYLGCREGFDRAWVLANLPGFFVLLLAFVFGLWAG